MASASLILETLQQSPMESPLTSPQKSLSDTTTTMGSQVITERPTHLTLDVHQQQQHSSVSSTSLPTSGHANISPGLNISAGSLSPSFLPEMPQWKRDLIQRRKQNVQRTINASSSSPNATIITSGASSSSSSPLASSAHSLKSITSPSAAASPLRPLVAGCIDQVPSDNFHQYSPSKDFNKLPSALKVNKQHNATAATTTTEAATAAGAVSGTATGVPATIKSTLTTTAVSLGNKEKSEKLFVGGQYTATIRNEIKTIKSIKTTTTIVGETLVTSTVNTKEDGEEEEEEVVEGKELKEELERDQREREEIFTCPNEYCCNHQQQHHHHHHHHHCYHQHYQHQQHHQQHYQQQHYQKQPQKQQIQQQQNKQQQNNFTMEEECLDNKLKKTKEYHATTTRTTINNKCQQPQQQQQQQQSHEEKEQNQEEDVRHITTIIKQQQQMATRLTGSSSSLLSNTNTSTTTISSLINKSPIMRGERDTISTSTSTSSVSASLSNNEREIQQQQQQQQNIVNFSITGANSGSSFQSSFKCESERLLSAANNVVPTTATAATTTTTTATVKISQKLQENQFIKNEQQQQKNKIIKFKTIEKNNSEFIQKSPTKIATTSGGGGLGASTTAASSYLPSSSSYSNIKKMVAMQEMKKSSQNSTSSHLHTINSNSSVCGANGRSMRVSGTAMGSSSQNSNDMDSNEDLSYGPGIVSKLRCRYLSLALRESMEQQRLNKDNLRRSTSLNNLLDDDDCGDQAEEEDEEDELELEEDVDDMGEENNSHLNEGNGEPQKNLGTSLGHQKKSGILKTSVTPASNSNVQGKRFTQGSNGVGVTFTETSYNKRSRHLKRGNDSLKRARSVEALLSEKSPWQPAAFNRNSAMPTCVTIEDKIHNARERLHQGTDHMPPKRLTSIIDDTEMPPPDLVKKTLKKFEASANRRPRLTNRSNSKGDVASKVETFKNIIKDQKPVVSYPKPSSPTKKLNYPNLIKPLKPTSTPTATQASDLLQTPLGRKTLAAQAQAGSSSLLDETPDIIPRQKLHSERELNKEKLFPSVVGINKEKFMNSLMETPLSTSSVVDSPTLKSNSGSLKEKLLSTMVDSPVTALTKELEKMKLNDIDNRKGDNLMRHNNVMAGSGIGGVSGGGGVVNVDDALHDHDNDRYNNSNNTNNKGEEMNTNEFVSLKKENDKISETTTGTATATANSNASETAVKALSSDLSDGEDDDECGRASTKRITRSALDNIAKAGTTQQFKFSTNTNSSSQQQHLHSTSSPSTSNTSSTTTTTSSSSAIVGGKQIGVIRPLLNTAPNKPSTNDTQMETLKHQQQHSSSSLTSREIEKNRINDLKKSSINSPVAVPTGPSATSSPSSHNTTATSLDNVIKSSSSSSSSLTATASGGYSSSDVDTVISATNSPLWAMRQRRQKPPAQPAENTSMVFNFSNRKEVPDYIENDGVIIRRKRELPKPNESGFVLLGDLSVETSTDMDYDDFSMCPPSPCDVEFVNANIVIDGKSSIRQKSKDATFRVQFNDTLTSTFEYPSEASLVVEDSFAEYAESEFNQALQNLVLSSHHHRINDEEDDEDSNAIKPSIHHIADEIIQLPTTNESSSSSSSPANQQQTTKNILGNLPLGSAPLGFYTPMKAPIDRLFQLGVTRAPALCTNDSTAATMNGDGGKMVNGKGGGGSGSTLLLNGDKNADNNDYSNGGLIDGVGGGEQEPESLQYIKPADDDLNIAYSEGTQKADLLY